MKYTGQKRNWLLSIETVKVGDYLLFINQPNSWDPKKPRYYTVECGSDDAKGLEIGMVLTKPQYIGGYWTFKTDLQTDEIYHRRDLLITKVDVIPNEFQRRWAA